MHDPLPTAPNRLETPYECKPWEAKATVDLKPNWSSEFGMRGENNVNSVLFGCVCNVTQFEAK